jgi:hypothetical protein
MIVLAWVYPDYFFSTIIVPCGAPSAADPSNE